MNRDERMNAVLDLLAERGRLSVEDLVDRLGISPATARRDLDTLAEQRLLTRTRGGALAQTVAYDLPLRYKNRHRIEEKQRIALAASRLVHPGAVVGLTGGTTTTAIANALSTRPDLAQESHTPNLTVVTNAVNIASQLATRPQIKVVVTGGVIHARSYELVGNYAEQVLASVTIDIAFAGVNGMDAVRGPTTKDEREAAVNTLLARRAGRAAIVADSSKFGRTAFATMGGPELFPLVITDSGLSREHHDALTDHGYQVVIAE